MLSVLLREPSGKPPRGQNLRIGLPSPEGLILVSMLLRHCACVVMLLMACASRKCSVSATGGTGGSMKSGLHVRIAPLETLYMSNESESCASN